MKSPEDNPTIDIVLCETKDEVVAQYAVDGMAKPMGISQYDPGEALTQHQIRPPKNVKVDIYNQDEIRRKYFTGLLYRRSFDPEGIITIPLCWPHLYDICLYCQKVLDFIEEHKTVR